MYIMCSESGYIHHPLLWVDKHLHVERGRETKGRGGGDKGGRGGGVVGRMMCLCQCPLRPRTDGRHSNVTCCLFIHHLSLMWQLL